MYRRPNWKPVSQAESTSWVRRYRASRLGLRQFAERNGISINRLRYWVYGNGERKASKPVTREAPVFQEIKLTGGLPLESWAVEASLPSGLVVRFNATAKPVWIGSVIQALQEPC
jgi:hypothetical protein